MKKVVKTTLLILWLIVIYYFSNSNADESLKQSSSILIFFAKIFNQNPEVFVLNFTHLIRKLAHFSEFFILFILSVECFKEYKINRSDIIALIFCVLAASIDETHQIFVDGRSGNIIDVLIDSSGALLAFVLWHLIIKRNDR